MPAAWIASTAAAVALLTLVQAVEAPDLSIPIDTSIEGGYVASSEASLTTAATADLEGATCTVRAVRHGGRTDTNRGNDLIVASGGDRVTLEDVEREPDAITEGGTLTLGSAISVTLVMGEDERFGASIVLEFDCATVGTTSSSTNPTNDVESTVDPSPPDSESSSDDDSGVTLAVVIVGAVVILGAAVLLLRLRREPGTRVRTDDEQS